MFLTPARVTLLSRFAWRIVADSHDGLSCEAGVSELERFLSRVNDNENRTGKSEREREMGKENAKRKTGRKEQIAAAH